MYRWSSCCCWKPHDAEWVSAVCFTRSSHSSSELVFFSRFGLFSPPLSSQALNESVWYNPDILQSPQQGNITSNVWCEVCDVRDTSDTATLDCDRCRVETHRPWAERHENKIKEFQNKATASDGFPVQQYHAIHIHISGFYNISRRTCDMSICWRAWRYTEWIQYRERLLTAERQKEENEWQQINE